MKDGRVRINMHQRVLMKLFKLNLMGSKLYLIPFYFFPLQGQCNYVTHTVLINFQMKQMIWCRWTGQVARFEMTDQGTFDLCIPREGLTRQIRGHLICSSQGRFWLGWVLFLFLQEGNCTRWALKTRPGKHI